jgi:hypothetical protein
MRVQANSRKIATIEFTKDELTWVSNALNEVCNGLDQREFSARMGATKPEILKFLHRVTEELQKMV